MNAIARATLLCALLSSAPTLTACRTTLPSAAPPTICRALARSDVLAALTEDEKALIRERFSRATKDRLKMNRAIAREIGC